MGICVQKFFEVVLCFNRLGLLSRFDKNSKFELTELNLFELKPFNIFLN